MNRTKKIILISLLILIIGFLIFYIGYYPKKNNSITQQKCIGGDGIERVIEVKFNSNDEIFVLSKVNKMKVTGPDTKEYSGEVPMIIKLDTKGNILDTKFLNLSDIAPKYEYITGILSFDVTQDGGLVLIGTVIDDVGLNIDPVTGLDWNYNILVLKMDNTLRIEWSKFLGNSYSKRETGKSISQTDDGGFIVSTSRLEGGIITIFKLDSNGNRQWKRQYGNSKSSYIGSQRLQLIQTNDGKYLYMGDFPLQPTENIRSYDIYLTKIDSGGDVIWEISLGGDSNGNFSLLNLENGNSVIFTTTENKDDFLLKDIWAGEVDINGNFVWAEFIYEKLQNRPESNQIIYHPSGNSYLAIGTVKQPLNQYATDIFLAKIGTNGEVIWKSKFGGDENDNGVGVIPISSSTLIIVGTTSSNNRDVHGNHGSEDIWFAEIQK